MKLLMYDYTIFNYTIERSKISNRTMYALNEVFLNLDIMVTRALVLKESKIRDEIIQC